MGTTETTGVERRWSRRKEARPAEIVAAALECFAERGFAGTTLDTVAARAGVTKGTLYLYFPNKEELFKAVVRESLLPHLEGVLGELSAVPDDPAERIRRLFGFFADRMLDSPLSVIPKLIVAEAGNFPEIARFYLAEVVSRGRGFLAGAIRQGIERGQFRPIDPEQAAYVLLSPMLLAVLWQRSLGPFDDRPFDGKALIRTHLDVFFRGIALEPQPPDREPRPS
ncbi:TetR/AcrR family transcriptional regulator [Tautonia sociabilis]|uniref:TetR/AcrR family transcriptional regulator n=1 Tax=Tautonia sociabilis TaxID=2080755 RepID=A0A432MK43_9BACT|nr:TetR/AcrR family transcriptional regulator [Tautonia sociabilis]RUL87498.1 TetR/AcrR family transcriptional regulator [Tautonia sociabilis]